VTDVLRLNLFPQSWADEGRPFIRAGRVRQAMKLACLSLAALLIGQTATQTAIANGDTRTITIYHSHTKETTTATFRRSGSFDSGELAKLNWALRDWRRDEEIRMDPRLFDVIWEVYREVNSDEPIRVVSAYRSPETNSMLRRRSRAVAKHSQHTMGKAMDFHLPDVSMAKVREIGVRLQRGGVGYYPSAYTPFVHLDVGSVRSWPRLQRDQLERIFPSGNTVHLPSDGEPMAGYETAKAQILARGGSVGGYSTNDNDEGAIIASGSSGKGFWATLFGSAEEDEAKPQRGGRRSVAQGRPGSQGTQTAALAPPTPSGDDFGTGGGSRMAALGLVPAQDTQPLRERLTTRARSRQETRQEPTRQEPARQEPLPTQAPVQVPEQTQIAALRETPANGQRASVPPSIAETPAAPILPRVTLVAAPLPVARPRGLQVAALGPADSRLDTLGGTGGALAFAPQPQARPSTLDALLQQMAPASGASAPIAPQLSTAAAIGAIEGKTVNAPQPPLRPAMTASLLPAAIPTVTVPPVAPVAGDAAPVSAPSAVGRLVVANHPAPPERPRATLLVAPFSASVPAQLPPPMDRNGLKGLFATAVQPVTSTSTKITTSKARSGSSGPEWSGTGQPAASLGFSQATPSDVRTDRFSGPAIRPLPSTFTLN
jgi:uncharacterized protein YcbK (DUF882 family)